MLAAGSMGKADAWSSSAAFSDVFFTQNLWSGKKAGPGAAFFRLAWSVFCPEDRVEAVAVLEAMVCLIDEQKEPISSKECCTDYFLLP